MIVRRFVLTTHRIKIVTKNSTCSPAHRDCTLWCQAHVRNNRQLYLIKGSRTRRTSRDKNSRHQGFDELCGTNINLLNIYFLVEERYRHAIATYHQHIIRWVVQSGLYSAIQ